jgi:hypothetical protein
MQPQPHPIFLDWEFWSAVAAFTALALSQLPPVHLWFRPKRRLEIEVHSRVQVIHKIGNPNLSMYVSVRNTGGREVEVRSIQTSISRDSADLGTLPAQSFFEKAESKSAVLFVPFLIKPGDAWSHMTEFYKPFDRASEKWYREAESKLGTDINLKRTARPQNQNSMPAEAEPQFVAPFVSFFEKMFVWNPGEYVISLRVTTRHKVTDFVAQYRFTLFESDTALLRSVVDEYKYGNGIYWTADRHSGVGVPITPHDAD